MGTPISPTTARTSSIRANRTSTATDSETTKRRMTPYAFGFTPILPGDWTIEVLLENGALLTAVLHVIPEPVAALSALAAVATLLALRRR